MTERQPGRDDRPIRQSPPAKPEPVRGRPAPKRGSSTPDEQALFNTDSDRRIFGEGSYAEGGSNQEGNFKERDATPEGSRGSFDDAGGYGGKELLGEKGAEEAARLAREASEHKTGPDESLDDT